MVEVDILSCKQQASLHCPTHRTCQYNVITSSSERSTSITTQPCRTRTRHKVHVAAITARSVGPSRLCWGGPHLLLLLPCLVRVCGNTSRSRPSPCVATRPPSFCPSCKCLALPVTDTLRRARSRVLEADGNHVWQAACRTAAPVNFCEGPCTCAHGSTTPMHFASCSKNESRLSPDFRTHHDLRRRRNDFCCAVQKNCRIYFEKIFSHTIRSRWSYGKKRFPIKYIAGIIPIGPGRGDTLPS